MRLPCQRPAPGQLVPFLDQGRRAEDVQRRAVPRRCRMTALVNAVLHYWLTCPAEEVRAAWIPSQAAAILAHRAEWWEYAAAA